MALPLLFAFLFMPFNGEFELYPSGDFALLEIYTLHATHWSQLLGPFSRFEWNHPGPAYFYMLSLFYQLYGHSFLSLNLGAFLINIIAILVIALIGYGIGGSFLFYCTAPLLAIYTLYLWGFTALLSPWNPFVTILPFGMFLFLSAALSVGRIKALPAGIAAASFVVQTHISYLPSVLAVFIVSLLLYGFPQLREKIGLKGGKAIRPLFWFVVSFLVLTVMWLPPIIEELNNDPGNLTKIYRFFKAGEPHKLSEAFIAVSKQIAALPIFIFSILIRPLSDDPYRVAEGLKAALKIATEGGYHPDVIDSSLAAGLITGLQIVLLPLAYWIGIRQQRHFCSTLALMGCVALFVAILSVYSVRGPLFSYLIRWTCMIGVINWAAIGGALLPSVYKYMVDGLRVRGLGMFSGITKFACVGVLVLVIAGNFVKFTQLPASSKIDEEIKVLFTSFRSYLEKDAVKPPIIRILYYYTYRQAAGVILQLYKARIPFFIDKSYLFMFGGQFSPPKSEGEQILFADWLSHLDLEFSGNPFYRLIAHNNDTFIYSSLNLNDIKQHLYRGKVNVPRAIHTRGDPAVVVDGRIPPEGTVWNSDECLVLSDQSSSIIIEVPEDQIEGLLISADSNDTYRLFCSSDGLKFTETGLIPTQTHLGPGMLARVYFNKNLSSCRFLKISPSYGDGCFSIGEVGFFTSKTLAGIRKSTIGNKTKLLPNNDS